ncbi:uncharacterized protein C4orf50 homolog [Arvicola amphibius]|uniref:uncharacterized protein C4orf50 homolog n=1 Tax=Arvicola amphibius TaxID=1047088 RepID=UPI001C094E42|nr:uncharacterized protein C4orf50 homolog [Arvicola amphibius]
MDPTAKEQTEKSFHYVIRAPSSDGFDVMNVDVKIDTSWVFRDVEESDQEQGCLPEAASNPDLDTGLLREQLESSERKLLAIVDKHVMSESGLRSRVEELELSERKLLLKVEQLRARMAQERCASLYAQERLQALQKELVSQVREAKRAARKQQRLQERLQLKDKALARQEVALERCGRAQRLQLGLVREQERLLRAQVQRLERDVWRLGRAAGLLLAQLHASDPLPSEGSFRPQIPAGSLGASEATELSVLRARAERAEREWAEAVRRLQEHSVTKRELQEQLEELRCCVYGLTLSEIGLYSQVEELAQQNRRLRAQLGHGSPGALSCAQSDSLHSTEVLDPCSSRGYHSDACGLKALTGQLSEKLHSHAQDQPDPCLVMPASTIGKLQEDLPGSEPRQGALVQPHLDGQILRLLCSCPPEPGMDERLCSLAGVSENLQATGAQESLLLLPTSMFPLWGPAGEAQPLLTPLLWKRLLQELQTQEEMDIKLSPAPEVVTHPDWPCDLARSQVASFSQESPLISNGSFPTKESKEPRDMWKERGKHPVASAEKWEVMSTLGVIKSELDDKFLLDQETSEKLIVDIGGQAPEGIQEGSRASETHVMAHCPWLWPECQCLLLTLHGESSKSQESPDPLRKRWGVEGCDWEHLGKLSPEKKEEATSSRAHDTRDPEPNGSQLPAGMGKEVWRRAQDKQGHQLCFGDTHFLQKEWSGEEEQEQKMQLQTAPSPAPLGVSEQLDSKRHAGQEQRLPMGDQDLLEFPKWAPKGGSSEGPCPSQTLTTGQSRSTLQLDTLEREVGACFQQLDNLKLVCGDPQQMSALMRKSQSVAYTGLDTEGDVGHQQALASQDLNAKSSRNGEGVRLEEGVALCIGEVLSGPAFDGGKANLVPAELSGSPLPPTWCTHKRVGNRFLHLLDSPKKERSQILLDNARVQGAQEGCHHEGHHCEKERAREVAKALRLEQANQSLQGELVRLRRELDQCLQAVSDLEDCNGKSYRKISQLEEENEKLKGDLGRLHKAMSESVRKAGSRMQHVTLENRELRALISELGVSYKGLIKDTMLGIEDMLWALQGENQHLVCRVQGLEREVLQMSGDPREEKWCCQGNFKMAGDKGHMEDKEVQVTLLSGQLVTRACGPAWDEKSGVTWGQAGPSLDLKGSRCGAVASSASSVCAVTTGPQEANTNGAKGDGARLQKEQETPWCSMQQGQSQRSLSCSLQLQTSKAAVPEEDPKLCTQRLHHQVRTLQCQLRDQCWALRELQVARDEAVGLQDKLKGKLEELQAQQHEALLAMSPLKAKLASMVHKCQERNRLIEQLLQELPRQEPKTHLLFELAQNMLDDEALAEYTATFLTPGALEVICHQDVGSKGKTARGGAQEYLLNSETDSILQSLWGVESWSLPGTKWAFQMSSPSSPKLCGCFPSIPGGWRDGSSLLVRLEGRHMIISGEAKELPATVLLYLVLPVSSGRERGFRGEMLVWIVLCPGVTDGAGSLLPLYSSWRRLASHQALRQSVCSNSQANKSLAAVGERMNREFPFALSLPSPISVSRETNHSMDLGLSGFGFQGKWKPLKCKQNSHSCGHLAGLGAWETEPCSGYILVRLPVGYTLGQQCVIRGQDLEEGCSIPAMAIRLPPAGLTVRRKGPQGMPRSCLHGPFFQHLLESLVVVAVKVQQGLLRFESEDSQNAQYLLDAHGKFKSPPHDGGQSSMNHCLPLQSEGVVSDLASRPLMGQCVPRLLCPLNMLHHCVLHRRVSHLGGAGRHVVKMLHSGAGQTSSYTSLDALHPAGPPFPHQILSRTSASVFPYKGSELGMTL